MTQINERWLELEEELGYNKCRILAHAVSYLGREAVWRFTHWKNGLSDEYKNVIDKYFYEMVNIETKEMSKRGRIDISHLLKFYDLPPDFGEEF